MTSKVAENVRGKAKLQRMTERKSKVIVYVREEKQSYRGCCRGKATLLRMTERKRKLQRMLERRSKVTKNVRDEKQNYRESSGGKANYRGC